MTRRLRRAITPVVGRAGLGGAVACSAALAAATVGAAGAGAIGMASMRNPSASAWPLVAWGRQILVVSVILFAVFAVLGARRLGAVVVAVAAGAVMFWGMYVQADQGVMYAAAAVGIALWLGLLVRFGWQGPARRAGPGRAGRSDGGSL